MTHLRHIACQGMPSSHPLNPLEGATGTVSFNAKSCGVRRRITFCQSGRAISACGLRNSEMKSNPWLCHSPEGFGEMRERHLPDFNAWLGGRWR